MLPLYQKHFCLQPPPGGGMHEHEILSALAALYDAGSGDGSLAPNPRLAVPVVGQEQRPLDGRCSAD